MRVSLTSTTLSIWTSVFFFSDYLRAENLTCYQCTRKTNTECGEEDLLPCSSLHDRCVTHFTKDRSGAFTIKRECGLAPCDFNDVMADKGLGLDRCDRSRDEYFCILCCKGNGCNKSSADLPKSANLLLLIVLVVILLNVVKNYQPPYLPEHVFTHK